MVSDAQRDIFCDAFGFADLKTDARAASNNLRVEAREWMMPIFRERLNAHLAATIVAIFEKHGLPFSPNTRPQDLLDDPHLSATGGIVPMTLPGGKQTPHAPAAADARRPAARCATQPAKAWRAQ